MILRIGKDQGSLSKEEKRAYRQLNKALREYDLDKNLAMLMAVSEEQSDATGMETSLYMIEIDQISVNPIRAMGAGFASFAMPAHELQVWERIISNRLVDVNKSIKRLNAQGLFDKVRKIEPLVGKLKKMQGLFKENMPQPIQNTAHQVVQQGVTVLNRVAVGTTVKESHMAGVKMAGNTAQYMVIVKGLLELIHILLTKKASKERILELAKNIGKASGDAYIKGIGINVFKNYLNSSSHIIAKRLGQTSLPALLVIYANNIIFTSKKLVDGEIDTDQYVGEMSKIFSEMSVSSAGITIGQVVIPIPVVGGIIGGMVAYTLNQTYFDSLLNLLKSRVESEVALEEERVRVQNKIAELRRVRKEFEAKFEDQYNQCRQFFEQKLEDVQYGILNNNRDSVIQALNDITRCHGGVVAECSTDELEDLVRSGKTVTFKI